MFEPHLIKNITSTVVIIYLMSIKEGFHVDVTSMSLGAYIRTLWELTEICLRERTSFRGISSTVIRGSTNVEVELKKAKKVLRSGSVVTKYIINKNIRGRQWWENVLSIPFMGNVGSGKFLRCQ
jgi:hypothetical protein